MSKARNKVIAGAYEGKRVGRIGSSACIILKIAETLVLDTSTIEQIELIDKSSDIDVVSATTRGFVGEMLFGPLGLAAAGTAEREENYILGVDFRDGQRSAIEVDGDLYRLIMASLKK